MRFNKPRREPDQVRTRGVAPPVRERLGARAERRHSDRRARDAALPDGQAVPMWGYTCGAVIGHRRLVHGRQRVSRRSPACWQPPLITVPSGQPLTITLINALHIPLVPATIRTSTTCRPRS